MCNQDRACSAFEYDSGKFLCVLEHRIVEFEIASDDQNISCAKKVGVNVPLQLIYLGVSHNGTFYDRSFSGIVEMISNAGGFLISMYKV